MCNPLQFRPVVPTQQGQPFISPSSQQYQQVGQGIPPSNMGMPPSQPLQFSQPMQQYPPRPSQPGHGMPSSQGLPISYIQTRPIQSGQPQSQQPAPPFSNQMPFSSSYSVRSLTKIILAGTLYLIFLNYLYYVLR